MNTTIWNEKMTALAVALRALGYDAKTATGDDGTFWLRVAENPNLRSPEIRGAGRYVWDTFHAVKPETMAKRLDGFLRSIDRGPGNVR